MVGKGHINTFSGGMDQDTAYSKYSNTRYESATNLRLITDDGLTTGAMINIEGNEKMVSLPNIVRMYRPDDARKFRFDTSDILKFKMEDGTVESNVNSNYVVFSSLPPDENRDEDDYGATKLAWIIGIDPGYSKNIKTHVGGTQNAQEDPKIGRAHV